MAEGSGGTAVGVRTVRVPDGGRGRADRIVADATGLSRSYVQKLISGGRLTAGGQPLRANAVVDAGHGAAPRRPAGRATRAGARAGHRAERGVRGRRPVDRRQAGRPRRASVPGPRDGDRGQRPAGTCRWRRVRRDRRRPAAGDRPPPRPRHERAADGRPAGPRAGLAHGAAQGPPHPQDVPGAGPGLGVGSGRTHRGTDRARPEAPHPDGRRPRRAAVDHRLSGPRTVRRLDPVGARPRSPGERTRSACTSTRSVIRWRATVCTAPGRPAAARTDSTGCSSTHGVSSSHRRPTVTSSAPPRRSRPSSKGCLSACAQRSHADDRPRAGS